MEDIQEEKKLSKRRRLGKILFKVGLLFEFFSIIFGGLIGLVSAIGVSQPLTWEMSNLLQYPVLIGIFMIVVGLITWIIPEGMSEDGVWIMKVGPFIDKT